MPETVNTAKIRYIQMKPNAFPRWKGVICYEKDQDRLYTGAGHRPGGCAAGHDACGHERGPLQLLPRHPSGAQGAAGRRKGSAGGAGSAGGGHAGHQRPGGAAAQLQKRRRGADDGAGVHPDHGGRGGRRDPLRHHLRRAAPGRQRRGHHPPGRRTGAADGAGDHRQDHPLPGGEQRRHEGSQGRQRTRRVPVHALHEPAG